MNRDQVIEKLMDFPELAEISVARVGPNDTIVIKADALLSQETMARMKHSAERIWPGRKIAILDRDLQLSITRDVDTDPAQ